MRNIPIRTRKSEFFIGNAEPAREFFFAGHLRHDPDNRQPRRAVDGLSNIVVDESECLPEQPECDSGGQENREPFAEETLEIATE